MWPQRYGFRVFWVVYFAELPVQGLICLSRVSWHFGFVVFGLEVCDGAFVLGVFAAPT